MPTPSIRGRTKQRWRLAKPTQEIVALARESRKSLLRVVELVSARTGDLLNVSDNGVPLMEHRPLTDEERIEYLQHALTWLQKSEELNRQLRGRIERALAKEWKSL